MIEQTLILIKPDAVSRNLIGEITAKFEKRNFRVVGLKMLKITKELAAELYAEHKGKDFYGKLIRYITSGPTIAAVLEGQRVIKSARGICGATDPAEAVPGTIRGDFGVDKTSNSVHASDSLASAKREIALFFKKEELYKRAE